MTLDDLFDQIRDRLRHARNEHPVFARDIGEALSVIESEMDELNRAHLGREGWDRIEYEGVDVITTVARLLLGEVKR